MLSAFRYLKPEVAINSVTIVLFKTYSDYATIALRILLTFPVSVASAERSFSKQKLIKTFVRSTVVQEKLDSVATMILGQMDPGQLFP